jgi:hypothetical protein
MENFLWFRIVQRDMETILIGIRGQILGTQDIIWHIDATLILSSKLRI